MNLYQKIGKMGLGSRLRRLSDTITEDATQLYNLYGVGIEPRWFPVFYTLMEHETLGTTEIAQIIQQSHASVSQIVKEMKKKELVQEVKDRTDGRKNLISLTEKGKNRVPNLTEQTTDVREAVEVLLGQMQYDFWKAIEEMEYLLEQQNLFKRVAAKKKERERSHVEIIDFTPEHATAFRDLNVQWIETYFKLEEKDLLSLNNPQSYILDKGGKILVAKYKGTVVGVAALLKMNPETYELAKMAVSPEVQGKGIGDLLMQASIQKAKELGASKLFLESNTILKPAISLYHKFGFKKVTGPPSPYERSNIQMELYLQ